MAPLVPLKSAYDVAINSSMYACLSVRSRISKTHKFKLYRIRVHVASRRGLVLYILPVLWTTDAMLRRLSV